MASESTEELFQGFLCRVFGKLWCEKMRLALGTVQFGVTYGIANQTGQVTRPEVKVMLQLAKVNGINLLDTAIGYGASETCLGEVGVHGFNVVTKLPAAPNSCEDIGGWVREEVASSLARLGVSRLYGLLLHRPEQLFGPNGTELYQALQSLKDAGQVEKVGVSIYAPSELEAITKVFHIDLVQAPFNLVDRRLQTTGWLRRLKDKGVEIHTRSVFLQGLLLMPKVAIPAKFSPWSGLWERWHNWLSECNSPAVQVCLAFPLTFPEIDRIIVGADSAVQLAQIITASSSAACDNFPDLHCEAENLINPSHWSRL